MTPEDESLVTKKSGGLEVKELSKKLVDAVNPDRYIERARVDNNTKDPSSEQIQLAAAKLIQEAVKPLYSPDLRSLLVEIKKKNEQTIDTVSQDKVIEAGFSAEARDRAKGIVQSFEKFIEDNKDEITALQILYSKPYKQRLSFESVKELAEAIEKPPYLWNESQLWRAYEALDKSKVRGASGKRILTDLVSLVRFAIHQDNELVPFPERVNANFNAWLAQQQSSSPLPQGEGKGEGGVKGRSFTPEQLRWLEMIRDHVAGNLSISSDDFDYAPFAQQGGLGKVHQIFGDELNAMIEELNGALAA